MNEAYLESLWLGLYNKSISYKLAGFGGANVVAKDDWSQRFGEFEEQFPDVKYRWSYTRTGATK